MNVALLLINRLRLIGSTLRSRPPAEKVKITRQFEAGFWPLLRTGELKPIIDCTFPIQDAQKAHEYVGQNKNIGKVILTIEDII